ncbi:MAG: hypothetical protein ACOZNI_09050 [Myxococcota bacterium]
MILLLVACAYRVLDDAESSLEARDDGEACAVCSLAGLDFAVEIHNPTDQDRIVVTGSCLVISGSLVNETTGTGAGWDDLCPDEERRWEIPAEGTVEHHFDFDEVEPGVQTLTVQVTDDRWHVLSVEFEAVE